MLLSEPVRDTDYRLSHRLPGVHPALRSIAPELGLLLMVNLHHKGRAGTMGILFLPGTQKMLKRTGLSDEVRVLHMAEKSSPRMEWHCPLQ